MEAVLTLHRHFNSVNNKFHKHLNSDKNNIAAVDYLCANRAVTVHMVE